MKFIDLSHTIDEKGSVYPGNPAPKLIRIATHNTNGYAELHLTLTTHTGTHIDAPFHMLEDGAKITDLPPESFYGKAYCISTDSQAFTLESLKDVPFGEIDFLLLRTGIDKNWGTDDYFSTYPVLTQEAARFVAGKGLKGVGIDAISIDEIDSTSFDIHKILLSQGMIIIENLTNLRQVCGEIFTLSVFPLKIKDADGSPVRAIGIIE